MKEIWKNIQGFEGLYKVSNKGQVLSVRKGILLKQSIGTDGYYKVSLCDGKTHYKRVNRLVAEAFIPKVEGKNIVNHIDLNKLNNNVDNLEWSTIKENTIHAYNNNIKYHNFAKYKLWKMSPKRNKKIAVFYKGEYIKTYNSKKDVAQDLNISEKTIYNRLNNKFSSVSGYDFKEVV